MMLKRVFGRNRGRATPNEQPISALQTRSASISHPYQEDRFLPVGLPANGAQQQKASAIPVAWPAAWSATPQTTASTGPMQTWLPSAPPAESVVLTPPPPAYHTVVPGIPGHPEHSVEIDRRNHQAFSAARHGRTKHLVALLSAGYSLESTDPYSNTLLHIAAQNGQCTIVDLLLANGGSSLLNCTNNAGQTALHYAFTYQYPKVTSLLLRQGANTDIRNKAGLTYQQGLR